jgi:hypothetical protein
MAGAINNVLTNKILQEKLKLIDGLRLYVEKHEEAKEKDRNIIYFDFLEKRWAEEEKGRKQLEEDFIYFNIERYV